MTDFPFFVFGDSKGIRLSAVAHATLLFLIVFFSRRRVQPVAATGEKKKETLTDFPFFVFGDSKGIRLSAVAHTILLPLVALSSRRRVQPVAAAGETKKETLTDFLFIGDSKGIRTPVAAVRGLSLNRLTMEP